MLGLPTLAQGSPEKSAQNLEVTSPDTKIRVEFALRDIGGRQSVAAYSISFVCLHASRALDYHCGSFHNIPRQKFAPHNAAPVTMGTRAHELARYVVYENYLPMTVDYPAAYRNQPGFEFLVQVPTTWDETRVLNGHIGSYLTIARRKEKQWYIGIMAGNDQQTLTIPLNFIGVGTYVAEIWSDDLTDLDEATKTPAAQSRSNRCGSVGG